MAQRIAASHAAPFARPVSRPRSGPHAQPWVCVQFPDPVIKIAIEPKTKSDQQKMTDGLLKLAQEDPSFHFSRDDETNQTVIEGMGELHLVSMLARPCSTAHSAEWWAGHAAR